MRTGIRTVGFYHATKKTGFNNHSATCMKISNLLVLLNCLATFSLAAQTNQPVIFPGDASTPGSLKLVWPATPGLRYAVQQSTNLQTWTTAPGYPAAASGPAQQM